jgi:hypothetical protein
MYKFFSEKVMGHDEHNPRIFTDTELRFISVFTKPFWQALSKPITQVRTNTTPHCVKGVR